MKKLLWSVMALCVVGAVMVNAETYTFDNAAGAGNNLWNTAGNWKTNDTVASTPPTAVDDVVANTSGGDALQIDTNSAVANNMDAGSTADSVSEVTIGSDGVLTLGGNQTFADGTDSSVTFDNAGSNIVTGIIQTLDDGSVTITNSGFMSSVSNDISIGANTVVTNSGTIEASTAFSVLGGAVVNAGTIQTVLDDSADGADSSLFRNGFSFENATNAMLDINFHLMLSQGTFTNRGTVEVFKSFFIANAENGSGESVFYNAEGASFVPKQIRMGDHDNCADGYLINKGTVAGNNKWSYSTMVNDKQTIQNDGTMSVTYLLMARETDSLSTLLNSGTLNINARSDKNYFCTETGTSVVHNTGTISLKNDMTLSKDATAYTTITNWGSMSITNGDFTSGNLCLAVEGETEFTMMDGTLTANALTTNGVTGLAPTTNAVTAGATAVLNLYGGTMTFDDVEVFDPDWEHYGSYTMTVREPGTLVVTGTNLVSELSTAISDGHISGSVTYDGSDTIVAWPPYGTVISVQ